MNTSQLDDLIRKLLDPTQRHLEPAAGAIGHTRMFMRAVNETERTIEFICSTGSIDRYGEIVEPTAFAESLSTFMRNPAFPASHTYHLPTGQSPTLGHWKSMRVTPDGLVGVAWFKPRGLGEEYWHDYVEGNLNAVSVGFLARAWEMRSIEIEGKTQRVRVFTRADLVEVSAVLVPANSEALMRAASAGLQQPGGTRGGDDLKQLETTIGQILERKLDALLDAGPGGRLCSLVQDIAEVMRSHHGLGVEDPFGDVHEHAGEAGPDDSADDEGRELKSMLRETLGAARDAKEQ